jgi:hypothetical protein
MRLGRSYDWISGGVRNVIGYVCEFVDLGEKRLKLAILLSTRFYKGKCVTK